ncbi:thiol-disulfide oxidoreductase DCC family protein [Lysinibacillus pakistanensis]|uniref:Thiol-disulfide oxidoreductase DCC family protein n=1 Tax=Lysinibacillus pakistanensis TaxID=759811 RepID=A0AAX3WQV8_9BACI|nr:thiol-disulfide oxidoreductase DCC family protein [Lysinibacillus pakistanensis]MDM5234645.1 thiol-disulfide oxidoreductase DCC family protein [Lysinibacillus pakistanensis]WHY45219.1 thiol-disulfide oxidoreductase DCC family protein [Lysinibacillus pakistanensis]WHY50228.1 thiol-disulfide oxidoreductase DCC family protein [Lysinibacillus pakistanensis]
MSGIILFDGVCNFCDSSVQFIIKHDQAAYFQFASIQSDIGQALLAKYNVSENVDSVILIEHGKAYAESTAALRISRKLDGFWPICYLFTLVPPFLRNSVYRVVAKNRYRLFGQKKMCLLPTPSQQKRFLKQ